MISLKWLWFRFLILTVLLIAEIVLIILQPAAVWWWVAWILFAYFALVHWYFSACPHCGKRFENGLVFDPFAQSAGICNHCRKEVKFKEYAEQEDHEE